MPLSGARLPRGYLPGRSGGDYDNAMSQAVYEVAIIGAGFAGIGMGIALKKAGIHNFVIFEKASGIGGCWRDNTYPGAACDVPSHLYSYSFEKRSEWSRVFAPQPEILAYLEHCVMKYELHAHMRFGSEVAGAAFDESAGAWTVKLADGNLHTARVLVTGCGQLSRPAYPKISGLKTFQGQAFHSARWDHAINLRGKRVAVIGTGASAIQFVPRIAPEVDKLLVFQRSPAWILPKPDRDYRPFEKKLFARFPSVLELSRKAIYFELETRFLGFRAVRGVMSTARLSARRHLRAQVKNGELRKKLSPDYPMGCKRILISDDYYPALCRDNTELITESITEVGHAGIVTTDGRERPADVLIYGTGFETTDFLAPLSISGLGGRNLRSEWSAGAEAYLGMAVNGFPNFFILYGPNTNLGHNSIIYMLEAQIGYIMQALEKLASPETRWVDVRAEIQCAYNQEIQAMLKASVWNDGCTSWYVREDGKNTNNWPDHTFRYKKRTAIFKTGDYFRQTGE